MGLLDKKICDICGEPIKFLGNHKLADGNMCKECAEKCSPYLGDNKQYTVDQIKAHHAAREENARLLENFTETRTYGYNTKIYIDDNSSKWLVNSYGDYRINNADVFGFVNVTGVNVIIDETKRQVTEPAQDNAPSLNQSNVNINSLKGSNQHNAAPGNPLRPNGNRLSLAEANRPAQNVEPKVSYIYLYDIYVEITLNHEWVKHIKFKVNSSSMENSSIEYTNAVNEAEEIKNALTGIHSATLANNAPKGAVTCPHCAAVTTPDKKGCCEYCGLKIEQ